MKNLVTGATGLLGSHIVEQLVREGEKVRCLVRKTSNTSFLDTLNVEKVYGDITDPGSLIAAFKDIDIVCHCAAKVSDWGPWEEFERTNVHGTRNCVDAALQAGVKRFLYVSTEAVYGYHRLRENAIDETAPLADCFRRWDFYDQTKVLAEELVWRLAHSRGLGVSMIRPGWIYGPRDRFSLKRLIRFVQSPLVAVIDRGANLLNLVHAVDVANAAILAAREKVACNQVYNVNSEERITAKNFFDTLVSLVIKGKTMIRSIDYSIAYAIATIMEMESRFRGTDAPPLLTRYAVVGLSCKNTFVVDKAKRELGWYPQIPFQEGIREAIEWCLQTLGEDHKWLERTSRTHEIIRR